MSGHSPFGMSVLARREACPGSARMEEGRPDVGTRVYAERGTNLHAVGAECLLREVSVAEYLGDDDVDAIDIVQPYVDVVRQAHARLGGTLHVEQAVSIDSLHGLLRGTADAVVIAPPVIWVGDLKTGQGHPVPMWRENGRINLQLAGYGIAAMETLARGEDIERIELAVIQPRLGPPRTASITADEVLDLAADLLAIVEAGTVPDAPLAAGEHCTFCRARGDCPALRQHALAAADAEFNDETRAIVLPHPEMQPPYSLAEILASADMIDLWIQSVRAHAKALADRGEEIPGWKLVDRRGRRVWIDDLKAARMMRKYIPEEELFTSKIISPAQADKAMRKHGAARPKAWNDHIRMTDPGTALAPVNDPRPAVAPRVVDFDTVKLVETGEQ